MATKITGLSESELVARIVADEERLRKWHRPRLAHLEETRLIRNLDELASIPGNDPFLKDLVTFVVSARPRLYWDWAVASLAANPFRYKNPYSTEARRWGQDMKGGAIVEYMAYGIEAQEDATSVARGGEPSRFELARQVVSGSYSFLPKLVRADGGPPTKGAGDEVVFAREFFDPEEVFWLPGQLGMQIVLRSYQTTQLQARLDLAANGKESNPAFLTGKDTDLVACIDYYVLEGSKVFNAFLATLPKDKGKPSGSGSHLALPLREVEGYEYIPIHCGCANILDVAPPRSHPAGGYGQGQGVGELSEWTSWGQSVLAPLIRVVRDANAWKTLVRIAAKQALQPTEERHTEGGVAPDEAPAKLGEQVKIIVRAGSEEGIKYIAKPPPALEVSRQTEEYRQDMDEASRSPTMTGQNTPQVASGFLLDQWRSNLEMEKLAVYMEVFKAVEARSKMQSIRKFKQLGGTTHLWGSHPLERRGLDGHFEGDFTPEMMPKGYWAIKVSHKESRAIDEAAVGNESRARLLSGSITMRQHREALGDEDPEGTQVAQDEEKVLNLPAMQARNAVDTQRVMLKRMRAQAKAATGEQAEELTRQANSLEVVYRQADLELSMMGRTMTPTVQGQAGREAPQPNASPVAPSPGPGVTPPEMRGEGKAQTEMKRMAGAPV